MKRARPGWLLLGLCGAVVADSVPGWHLQLDTEAVVGEGIEAVGVRAVLEMPAQVLELQIDSLKLPGQPPVSDIRLRCPRFDLASGEDFSCHDGRLSFVHPALSIEDTPLELTWNGEHGGEIRFLDAPVLGATKVAIQLENGGWTTVFDAPAVSLGALYERFPLGGIGLTGTASMQVTLTTTADDGQSLDVVVSPSDMSFEDPEGQFIGAALDGSIRLSLDESDGSWQGRLNGRWTAGELLTPAAYANAEPRSPVTVEAALSVDRNFSEVAVSSYDLAQSPLMRIGGSLRIRPDESPAVRFVEARFAALELGPVYARYVEPVLVHPLLSALEIEGTASGHARWRGGRLTELDLSSSGIDVTVDTETAALGVEGLAGHILMDGRGSRNSRVSWQGARVFGFDLGPVDLPLAVRPSSLALAEPVRLPVLDGDLDIERFALDWSETPPEIVFDGVLAPVSMEAVTAALGWIPMQGKLSGVIPRVALRKGSLSVGGNLLVRAFDGDIVIRNLGVSDVFGYWPVLTADLSCRNLALEMVTGTYEFGRITGRVDGVIDELRLENWRPAAFDARFVTTPGDDSAHRISQRAIDNITSLSGGAGGAVSRTLLRVFKDFGYRRLGISCRLKNGVCEMDGVAPAKGGYYLVEGGGIPRIDVIGFNRSIDWDVLVDRLVAITETGPPTIE